MGGRTLILLVRSLVLAAIAAFGALAVASLAEAAESAGVRVGVTSRSESRVVVDLPSASPYSVAYPDKGGKSFTVDFPKLAVAPQAGKGAGLISRYAWSRIEDGSRLTIDMTVAGGLKANFELAATAKNPSHRVVFDFVDHPVSAPVIAPVAAARPQPVAIANAPYEDLTEVLKSVTAPTPATATIEAVPTPSVAALKAPLRVIVIDPGHGGTDPGANSTAGVEEKSVTLAAAKRLSEILQERGRYQIVLTRADDSRLALEQRAKIARDAGADLFISLHADANEDANVRGGSIYTLSEDGTERSAREAQSSGNYHNVYGEDLEKHGPDLSPILYDLAQKTTLNRSARFADELLKHVKGVTVLLNNSHRVADLRVLLSPDVPAVLFELAFISNDEDAANLTSPQWRTKTMTAVADSIDDYFKQQTEARQTAGSASGQ